MPERSPRRLLIAVLLALAFEGIAFSLFAATNAPLVLTARRADGGNLWQLSWQTQPGIQYILQKSADLALWADVVTVIAESNSVTRLASAIPNETKTFWRVVTFPNSRAKGDSEPLTVSPVVVSYQLSDAASRALLRIVTGGTQTVNSVMFFDNGMLLGNALPGFGNTWTFNLVWDGATPQTRQVSATVTTDEGTTNETPVSAFLLADPARFVPVRADSTRAYGEFVSVDTAGNLGAFLFYPEGLGDAAMMTGACFEFSAGASLRTQGGVNEIEFSNGEFFRGHQDTTPIVASAGTHRINIDAATPAAVAAAMGLPGSSVQLLWGSVPVDWLSGALSDRGWAGLIVRPPIGSFPLPNGQECALVSFDPKSSDPTLIVCYHGDWAPFDGGPQFRIPRSEPLKIYLSLSGKIAAHGTVEAMFANGATLRGSVSWREPNFEVRLQGRNITIPALTSLKRALPANPSQVIPAGDTTAELDVAAQALASFRDTYRSLAMGGLAESRTTSTEKLAPLGQPHDPSGTALQAWASRLASWSADRAGQVLDAEQIADLRKVIENAGKTGEAAHDLPTVLKLLRDVLVASRYVETALSGSDIGPVRSQLDDTRARLFGATERIADDSGALESSTVLTEIVELLSGTVQAEQTSPQAGFARTKAADPAALRRITQKIKQKLGPKLIQEIIDAAANRGLAGKSSADLLFLLTNLREYLALALTGGEVPSGHPTVQDVHRAALNVRPHFVAANDRDTIDGINDYPKLRNVLAARARFFEANDKLDKLTQPAGLSSLTLDSDEGGFAIQTFVLIHTFTLKFNELQKAAGGTLRACQPDMEFFSILATHTADKGTKVPLARGLEIMNTCSILENEARASSSDSTRCNELRQALLQPQNQFIWGNRDPVEEGRKFYDVTGTYESVETADLLESGRRSYVTLQLNQGGRYVEGSMQQRVEAGATIIDHQTFKLDGLFLRQTELPGHMEIGLRSVSANRVTNFFKAITQTNSSGFVLLTLVSPSRGEALLFQQISHAGVFPESVYEAFDPNELGVVRASDRSPLHSRKAAETSETSATIRFVLDDYFDAQTREQELNAVSRLQGRLALISSRLTPDQRPNATALMRQVLMTPQPRLVKTSKLPGGGTVVEKPVRYWDLLLAMSLREGLDISAQLGVTPEQLAQLQGSIGRDDFHYELVFRQKSAAAGVEIISAGVGELDVAIKKFRPAGVLLEEFDLHGTLTLVGLSFSPVPFPFSCSAVSNTFKFSTPYDFSAANFAGDIEYKSFGVSHSTPIPIDPLSLNLALIKELADIDQGVNSWQVGYLTVYGGRNFPPMTFVTKVTEGLQANECLNVLSIGGEKGQGNIRATWPGLGESFIAPTDPIPFDPAPRPDLHGGIYFETDGTNLTECGWQFLREFVAENHELLVGSKAGITIVGHADARNSGEYNQRLSSDRASSVRRALRGLISPRHRPVFNVVAKGEEEHDRFLGIGPDVTPTDPVERARLENPAFRRADIIVGGVIKATMPGAPSTAEP